MGINESPTIELYMYSFNQEFPSGIGHSMFLKKDTFKRIDSDNINVESLQVVEEKLNKVKATEWPAEWLHNQWLYNTKTINPEGSESPKKDALNEIVVREEDFGAILLDPINDRIYKTNPSGLNLFNQLLEMHKQNKLAEIDKLTDYKSEDIKTFIDFLREAGVWPQ